MKGITLILGGLFACLILFPSSDLSAQKNRESKIEKANNFSFIAFAIVPRVDTKRNGLAPAPNKDRSSVGAAGTKFFVVKLSGDPSEDLDSLKSAESGRLCKELGEEFLIDSFFDVFTELSVDGGKTFIEGSPASVSDISFNYEEIKWTYSSGSSGEELCDDMAELLNDLLN